MMSCRLFVVKVIVLLFLSIVVAPLSYANPVPAFCMLGVLNHDADWAEACEGISSVYERDLVAGKDIKRYSVFGGSVYERDLATRKDIKSYSVFGGSVYERDLATRKDIKRYSVFGGSVYERDLATRKDIKRYSMR